MAVVRIDGQQGARVGVVMMELGTWKHLGQGRVVPMLTMLMT